MGKEVIGLTPTKQDQTNNNTSLSSDVTKLDTSAPETFDVKTRNDLEVKIPKDSYVKTPETPKAKEGEEHPNNFSKNWEVKFPEELEAKKISEVVKVAEDSAPKDINVTKEPIEDKDIPEVSKGKSDEVKIAKSALLKVSEVKSSDDLKIKIPNVFEVKTPETSKSDKETEVAEFVDAQEKIDNKTDVSKIDDTSAALMESKVKAPETFDVQTRNDLEVKIPKDYEIKTPETPKANETKEHGVHFSKNLEVKVPEELQAKKVQEVSTPKLSKINVTKESNVPEVSTPKATKKSNIPTLLKDKKLPEVSRTKSEEVKVAKSNLLQVSEVRSSDDLKIKIPKVFEVKTPEIKVTNDKEIKSDHKEASKVKITEEPEVAEFVDAQDKIDKSDQDKEVGLSKAKKEEKDLPLEKKVKDYKMSRFGRK